MKRAFTLIEVLIVTIIIVLLIAIALPKLVHASADLQQAKSASGVSVTQVNVPLGTDGLTTEQRNVRDRLLMDNKPGSIKHLYVISAYSGQVLIYSTVKGKVTSSGKRLSPMTVATARGTSEEGFPVNIGGNAYYTGETLEDDGTYGSSVDYIYWWDVRGVYHQQYVTGGMIVHISDQPLAVKSVVINMEETPTSDK